MRLREGHAKERQDHCNGYSARRDSGTSSHDIAQSAGVKPSDIYIDVPNTPSVPYTYERQAFNSITLFSNDIHGGRRRNETVPISELPLVGSITGFMDILRIYTFPKHRSKVVDAVENDLRQGRLHVSASRSEATHIYS